jgi:hypothetical protein
MTFKSPIVQFIISLLVISIFTTLGPSEATLGRNARIVYLHGAWVWVALAAFIGAGLVGLMGLLYRLGGNDAPKFHQWSRALGRTGLFFWITYLPISLWAMQANWNGLFLAEPRWRIALVFAVTGSLLQLGLSFLPASWASFWNLAYIIALFVVLQTTVKVMHPPSPMLESNAWRIQVFFGGLTLLVLFTSLQVARWFRSLGH